MLSKIDILLINMCLPFGDSDRVGDSNGDGKDNGNGKENVQHI
jgi:hypothetical protein